MQILHISFWWKLYTIFQMLCDAASCVMLLCDAVEAYTHDNYATVDFVNFWTMQWNVHIEYCSQVSCLHRSSLFPIVLLLHSAFLSAISVQIQLRTKASLTLTCADSNLVPSGPLMHTDLPSWGWPIVETNVLGWVQTEKIVTRGNQFWDCDKY